jgi:DNA polymerase-3 subunit delta
MTFSEIQNDLKAGKFAPVYFLHGEEPYYIDLLADYMENHVLTEAEKAFNQVVIYGKEAEIKSIIDEACQYPMMASRRVIIIKEAQDMKNIAGLQPYIEKPVSTTLLVLCYKYNKIDKRTKFSKILDEKAVVFESKKVYENQVASWIKEYLKSSKYTAENGVADLLAEYLGTDLSKISNELSKLMLNVSNNQQISVADVKEQIGISKEFDVFELQRMLGEKNFVKCNLIIRYFSQNQSANPAPMIISSLFGYFNKVMISRYHVGKNDQELGRILGVNPYFVKEYRTAAKNYPIPHLSKIFNSLKMADKFSKGVGSRRSDVDAIYKDILICCMQA